VLQLAHAGDLSGGEEVYFKVIRGKTAALFEAATQSGAVVAEAGAEKAEALRVYGDSLGLAFQIADDLLDYGGANATIGKDRGDDFREGKATLPVLLAYAQGDAAERDFWRRVIVRREQRDGDLDAAMSKMRRCDAFQETRRRADACAATARAALGVFPPSPLRDAMADIVDFVVARAH
jgi:octaprenyl-diphosphate synthase